MTASETTGLNSAAAWSGGSTRPSNCLKAFEQVMYTREEFEALRRQSAKEMSDDPALRRAALAVLASADRYHWIHQTNWFGEPVLQLPQDMFAFQEIIFRTRPRFIIEVRSEEHTSELQSRSDLVCRLLPEKKKKHKA